MTIRTILFRVFNQARYGHRATRLEFEADPHRMRPASLGPSWTRLHKNVDIIAAMYLFKT